jgi:2-polyprenyl-6-hydroxyphenyl methylase/3-demethylubiquinone-9 3-methyltransferase
MAQRSEQVDNALYEAYGERWYTARNDPVALLRAEGRTRNPWIVSEVRSRIPAGTVRVLDIGCGAGFLANELARNGFSVTGIDMSESSLEVARRHDTTGRVAYRPGDGCRIEAGDATFDVACAMDLLEHVEQPEQVVAEAARVLRPGGLFFFHTFNRNFLSWLVVVKGVEWFVRNTPPAMHRLRYFIKPAELRDMCLRSGLQVICCRGFMPQVTRPAFWRMLVTGSIGDDFTFEFTRNTWMGYTGVAIRSGVAQVPRRKGRNP